MLFAHKIELRPTPEQEQFLLQSVGVRRFVYNYALDFFNQPENKYSKKTSLQILKELRISNPWLTNVSSRAARCALEDLDKAFQNFFEKSKSGEVKKALKKRKKPSDTLPFYPKLKKKGHKDSFSLREKEKFDVGDKSIRIEKLKSRIKMREHLRLKGTPKQVTISLKAGKWFASILVDCAESFWSPIDYATRKPSVGVDLGIKTLATLSDGKSFPANPQLKKQLSKLARLQRKLENQVKGSNRRNSTKLKIQKLYFYVTKRRNAILHELTDWLTRSYDRIVIEDLNVSGMTRNRRLARSVMDVGFFEFRRQLEYKGYLRGCEIVVANRFFPSSRMCSGCGSIHDMPLWKREMVCDCGLQIDRDLNAAINLEKYKPLHVQEG